MRTSLRDAFRILTIVTANELRPDDECLEFRDPMAALDFLRRLLPVRLNMPVVREVLAKTFPYASISRLPDEEVLRRLSVHIAHGTVKVAMSMDQGLLSAAPGPRPERAEMEVVPAATRGSREPRAEKTSAPEALGVMTISFVLESAGQVELDYPRYLLESEDGAYRSELSPKDDMIPNDQYLQLRFEKLPPGTTYTLTRFLSSNYQEIVFRDMPFDAIVDQDRPVHAILEDHDYAELDIDLDSDVPSEMWDAEEGAGNATAEV